MRDDFFYWKTKSNEKRKRAIDVNFGPKVSIRIRPLKKRPFLLGNFHIIPLELSFNKDTYYYTKEQNCMLAAAAKLTGPKLL